MPVVTSPPSNRSRWLASAILGALVGAGAMYAFNRQPSPIRAAHPVVTVVAPQSQQSAPAPSGTPPTDSRPPVERLQKRVAPLAPIEPPDAPPPSDSTSPSTRPSDSSSPSAPNSPPALNGKLNVNTASAAELELLPGVGPVLSKAIIDYREKNGPFKSIFELDHVKGIGPRTLERLAPLVTVDPPLPSR